jgi:hypothetical protein
MSYNVSYTPHIRRSVGSRLGRSKISVLVAAFSGERVSLVASGWKCLSSPNTLSSFWSF